MEAPCLPADTEVSVDAVPVRATVKTCGVFAENEREGERRGCQTNIKELKTRRIALGEIDAAPYLRGRVRESRAQKHRGIAEGELADPIAAE
jgi:hypothetical protein